jgi:hypothetical protein
MEKVHTPFALFLSSIIKKHNLEQSLVYSSTLTSLQSRLGKDNDLYSSREFDQEDSYDPTWVENAVLATTRVTTRNVDVMGFASWNSYSDWLEAGQQYIRVLFCGYYLVQFSMFLAAYIYICVDGFV